MARFLIKAALMAVLASMLPLEPAQAQFDWLFGKPPPRPPGNVPTYPPVPGGPVPGQTDVAPGRLPPRPSAQPRPRGTLPNTARRAPGIQTQPLPPPPGTAPAAPGRQPQQAQPGIQPLPPGLRQPAAPQQANVTPQTDDVTVTEMPTQKIANERAVFSGLDKITGRIITFDVAINETVQFGALQVTPKVCYTRPPTETANTDAFVQVDEVTLQGEVRRIFSGWMFAASPGLHAVEHPIYDVWLTDCKAPEMPVAEAPDAAPDEPAKPPLRPQRRGDPAPRR